MHKRILYVVIAGLLCAIGFLVWSQRAEAPVPTASESDVTNPAPSDSVPTTDEPSSDQIMPTGETVQLTGTLTGFVPVAESTGAAYTEATVFDGSELLRVDLRGLALPGDPAQALADRLNTQVTFTGFIDNGVFVATEIE